MCVIVILNKLAQSRQIVRMIMQPRQTFFCHILSVGLLVSCGQNNSPTVENEKKAITEISNARAKAFNEGNAAAIAIHFTTDAVLMAPDKPAVRGRESVESYYQAIFDSFNTALESHYEEVEVSGGLA